MVLGTKEGTLEMFDLPSSTIVDNVKAHEGHLWSCQVSPDGKGLVTGSADKTVKFWSIDVVSENVPDSEVPPSPPVADTPTPTFLNSYKR